MLLRIIRFVTVAVADGLYCLTIYFLFIWFGRSGVYSCAYIEFVCFLIGTFLLNSV